MALIKCQECNKSVSDTVDKCPHCGYDNIRAVNSSNIILKTIFILFNIVMFFLVVVNIIHINSVMNSSPNDVFSSLLLGRVADLKIQKLLIIWGAGAIITGMLFLVFKSTKIEIVKEREEIDENKKISNVDRIFFSITVVVVVTIVIFNFF